MDVSYYPNREIFERCSDLYEKSFSFGGLKTLVYYLFHPHKFSGIRNLCRNGLVYITEESFLNSGPDFSEFLVRKRKIGGEWVSKRVKEREKRFIESIPPVP